MKKEIKMEINLDLSDVINYIKYEANKKEKEQIFNLLSEKLKIKTLDDVMKIEILEKYWHLPSHELERKLNG